MNPLGIAQAAPPGRTQNEETMKRRLTIIAVVLLLAGPTILGEEPKPLIKDFVGINGHFHLLQR